MPGQGREPATDVDVNLDEIGGRILMLRHEPPHSIHPVDEPARRHDPRLRHLHAHPGLPIQRLRRADAPRSFDAHGVVIPHGGLPGAEPGVRRRLDRRVEDGEVHSSLRLPQAGVVTDCQWDTMKLLADLLVRGGQVGEALVEFTEERVEDEAGGEAGGAVQVGVEVVDAFGGAGAAGVDLVDDGGG